MRNGVIEDVVIPAILTIITSTAFIGIGVFVERAASSTDTTEEPTMSLTSDTDHLPSIDDVYVRPYAIDGLELSRLRGVPSIVSQEFPKEVWRIGDHRIEVEMGTRLHSSLISAAKLQLTVSLVTKVEFPPVKRGALRGEAP